MKHDTILIILIQAYFLYMREDLNLHVEKTHSIAGKSNLGKTEIHTLTKLSDFFSPSLLSVRPSVLPSSLSSLRFFSNLYTQHAPQAHDLEIGRCTPSSEPARYPQFTRL